MNSRVISCIFASGLVVAGGCAQEADFMDPLGEESVATIDGVPIQSALFNYYARGRLQKDAELLTDDEYDALMQELIEFRLLARSAESDGLTNREEVAAQLEIQRLQALARVTAANYLEENPATEAELQIAYQQNLPQLSGPQYKARHILVEEEEEALGIIQELQSGADFQELARTRSTGPSGPNGGDLGWFTAETMVAPFANAVLAMEVGTFTEEPIATRFGWHVILLEDSAEQQAPGLDAVRDEMTTFVEQQKIQDFLESLQEAAEITVGNESSAP